MRIVVIGATGNVGTAVIESLLAASEHEVVGVARRVPSFATTACATGSEVGRRTVDVEWIGADITVDALDFVRGADAVIHLAWQIQPVRDAAQLRRVNVEGTARVVRAVQRHRVPRLVIASSVGAYAPGAGRHAVDETWPATGIASSVYSRQKAEVETLLDSAELDAPDTTIVRLRTALVFGRRVASEIDRYFLGPLSPTKLIGKRRLPFVPLPRDLTLQAVHSADVGDAYRLAATQDVRGSFNVAAPDVLDADDLAQLLGGRRIIVPHAAMRYGAGLTHALRLQRTSMGWVDLGLGVPTMDTARATTELQWSPQHSARHALCELLEGFRTRAGAGTPPLEPGPGGAAVALGTYGWQCGDARSHPNHIEERQ